MRLSRSFTCSKNSTLYYNFGLRKIQFGSLGENVRINYQNSHFGNAKNIFIDDDVFISRNSYFDAVVEIHIGEGTMIGPGCMFIGGTHHYEGTDLKSIPYDNVIIDKRIIIEKNVWIAANVTVSPGCHIGEGCVIGAGACIYGDIPAYSVVVSSGYRVLKKRDVEQYKELVAQDMVYNKCFAGKPFEIREG